MSALLEVSGLGKSFGGNRAVDGISFTVARGELLALIDQQHRLGAEGHGLVQVRFGADEPLVQQGPVEGPGPWEVPGAAQEPGRFGQDGERRRPTPDVGAQALLQVGFGGERPQRRGSPLEFADRSL